MRSVSGTTTRMRSFVFSSSSYWPVHFRKWPWGIARTDQELIDLRQTRWDVDRTQVDLKYIPGVVVVQLHPRAKAGDPPTRAKGR